MTKNTMNDLNDHLFMALERLNDENLSGEELQQEIERSKAISEVGKTVIDNAKTVLSAMKFNDEKLDANMQLPKMLGGGS
jgi:hypothetical protein